jgi:transcriptional regulator with XRE-family HTH domain
MPSPDPHSRQAVTQRFGENLRRAREGRGWSQETLAEHCGIHRTEASLLDRGQREPELGTLVKLADALEVPMAELCEGVEWQPPERGSSTTGRFKSPQMRA